VKFWSHPVGIAFGADAADSLGDLLDSAPAADGKILLLTRGGDFAESAEGRRLQTALQGRSWNELPFAASNPDIAELLELRQGAPDFDLLVAVGGGSVLDVGKALAAMRGLQIEDLDALRRVIEEKSYIGNPERCAWIGIPTTSGTGSEVTPWASLWDRGMGLKRSIDDHSLFAHAAVIDPIFTRNLPLLPTVSTGLDAICHATESYWARPASALTRPFSLAAIELLAGNLQALTEDMQNLELREKVALGSLLAGLAFSNTRTTACHSISYPLTLMFGIDHGIAVSMTLAAVMAANTPALREREKLLRAFGAADADGVQQLIDAIMAAGGIKSRLGDYGVSETDIDEVVKRAFTKGRMDNNPIELSQSDVKEILHARL
jgi:phosphonate metabolism-associated iron-containing alcohol dehydrogenase